MYGFSQTVVFIFNWRALFRKRITGFWEILLLLAKCVCRSGSVEWRNKSLISLYVQLLRFSWVAVEFFPTKEQRFGASLKSKYLWLPYLFPGEAASSSVQFKAKRKRKDEVVSDYMKLRTQYTRFHFIPGS